MGQPDRPETDFPVVGVGASAGGLEAFRRLLSALPERPGMALVLVQHLDPGRQSLMAGLLAKHTALPVREVVDDMLVEKNHIYAIPPGRRLQVRDGKFHLSELEGSRVVPTVIDHFFFSLAEACGPRAICVVLSGLGADGSRGLRAVKAAGGLTIAADPEQAAFDGMPRSAIATGLADFVLPVEKIPRVLKQCAEHPYVARGGEEPAGNGEGLETVFSLLRARTGHDFRSYKPGTVRRRIGRRMGICHVESLRDYLEVLRRDSGEVRALFQDLLIGVTSFFRDPESWEVLEKEVLEPLIRDLPAGEPLRVWVPGCSSGEEAYSVAMALAEGFERCGCPPRMQVFATDIDDTSVARGRMAAYPKTVLADIPPSRARRFLVEDGERVQISKSLRDSVVFARQNVIGDPPFSRLHLICCRNLMIYLDQETQQRMVELFHFALVRGGCLFLGSSESIGRQERLFQPVSKVDRIFRRRETDDIPRPGLHFQQGGPQTFEPSRPKDPDRPRGVAELARLSLLEHHTPAAVVVDSTGEVRFFHGPVSRYLEFPVGEPTRQAIRLCRKNLRSVLRAAIHRAETSLQPEQMTVCQKSDQGEVAVTLSVRPLGDGDDDRKLLMVTFSERPMEEPEDGFGPTGAEDLIGRLEADLEVTRESLQSTIEEQETANEELKASHEEVMSMNEELQSANEELETSREELQSLNEELTTVNAELEEKVRELESANDDLDNLLSSTDIATIFLDPELGIRRFTPATRKLIHLIPADVGRPLSDIAPRFLDEHIFEDARRVLETQELQEKEIAGSGGESYLRRIVPYRSASGRIDGVVITFSDVSDLRRQARQLQARERQQAAIAKLGQKALAGMPLAAFCGEVVEACATMLGVPMVKVLRKEDASELLLYAGIGWQEGAVGEVRVGTDLDSQAGYTLKSNAPVIVRRLSEETRFRGPELLRRHGVVSGLSVIIGTEQEAWGVLGAHSDEEREFTGDDIHFLQALANIIFELVKRDEVVEELRASRQRYRLVADSMPALLAMCDADERYVFANAAYRDWLGLEPEEMIGRTVLEVVGEEAYAEVEKPIRGVLAGERQRFRAHLAYRLGKIHDVEVDYLPDIQNGEVVGYFAMIQDISERLAAEQLMEDSKRLLESEVASRTDQLRVLSDNVPALFAYIDPERRFRYLNRLHEEEFHMKPGEFIGRPVAEAFGEENYAAIEPYLEVALTGEEQHFEVSVDLPRDGVRAYRVHYVPHLGGAGEVRGIFALSDDVTRMRQLQKDVLEAAEREKERIGRELHDSLCQDLSGVGMLGQALSKKLSRNDSRYTAEVEGLVRRINKITHQSREIARGLCPVALQDRGLGTALGEFCEVVPDLFDGLSCDFEDRLGNFTVEEPVATQLFIIAREAIFNAARHANAELVTVTLSREDRKLLLRVCDDGDGRLDEVTEGLGIRSMRYRALTLGGTFSLQEVEQGTGLQMDCTIRLESEPVPAEDSENPDPNS
ncbi:chemotaxis protein CheB [Haloferula sargassicola]